MFVKNTILSLKLLFLFTLCIGTYQANAQNAEQRKQITKDYDFAKIAKLKAEYAALQQAQKTEALEAAKRNGWPIYRKNANGTYDELMSLTDDGKPIYFSLDNLNAAKSTRANTLHSGGILGLDLNGQGMYSGVWDGAPVRTTHQEFGGRVIIGDGVTTISSDSNHATHVSGTVAAAGVQSNAKGMAPQSIVKSFDWNSDLSEVFEQASNGLLLSNHSYGVPVDNAPGNWYMGAYSNPSRIWDQMLYNVPYFLMVASAGNDGNTSNPAPLSNGYDKLTSNKTCKNNLVVANCQDANVDAQGNLLSVSINSSSSEGPTDDRRIKPDITGNGSGLTSSIASSNTSYASYTGTSMASPNVMGTLVLLQQHYNNVNSHFMRAATLKALACHTADDKGKVGPDPVWGWGLLNAKKAAQAISQNGLQSWISEETLEQGQTFTFTAVSDGVNPLLASICWTDIAGIAHEGSLNNATPVLVNDLDIRITQNGNTYFPWKLQSDANLAAIATADNNVDNVERINVNAPSGTYTITVTHKGTLVNGPQKFAFVVTGLSSQFSIAALSEEQTACLDGSANYNFNFTNTSAIPTNFTANGLPAGAVATFSPPSLSASGAFNMQISNLQNAAPGIYQVVVTGDNGAETENRTILLKVSSTDFSNVLLSTPVNEQTGISTSVQLSWNATENADTYHIQIATDSGFNNIIAEGDSSNTTYNLSGLVEGTDYFWRVYPANACGQGNNADEFTFQTGQLICNNHFEPNDYDNGAISDQGNGLAIIQIPVTGGLTVGDINVQLNISHSYIGDCTVELEGPFALGFPKVTLLYEPCGDVDNIDCTFDDSAANLVCNASTPGISGFVIPYESLSLFNNKPAGGTWTIYVRDPYVGDGGQVNFAALDICTVQPLLGVTQNELDGFSIHPNPSKGIVNIQLPASVSGKVSMTLYDIQGRKIISKNNVSAAETVSLEHLQNGVYLMSLENGTQKAVKKLILNK